VRSEHLLTGKATDTTQGAANTSQSPHPSKERTTVQGCVAEGAGSVSEVRGTCEGREGTRRGEEEEGEMGDDPGTRPLRGGAVRGRPDRIAETPLRAVCWQRAGAGCARDSVREPWIILFSVEGL
jgi:hypothetical protein